MVAQLALRRNGSAFTAYKEYHDHRWTYKAARLRIRPTENLTRPFIWTFHSRAPGRMARVQSVTIETAEKKKLTLLFNIRLQVPCVVSPHSVVMGWQMLAMATMKMMEAVIVMPIIAHIV